MLSDNLADKLNFFKAAALSSLDRAGEKVSTVNDYFVARLNRSFGSSVAVWLNDHPLVAWAVNHPFIAFIAGFIVAVLTIRLIVTIYQAISNTIDRMWLGILRSPVNLFKWIFGWKKAKIASSDSSNTIVTNYEVTNDSEKIALIMARLDVIQQQQSQIIQDLAALKQKPLTVETQHLKLTKQKTVSPLKKESK